MARINVPQSARQNRIETHEGGIARRITPEQELRRSLMSCLLWENTFYEDGIDIAQRISDLIPKVKPQIVREMAVEARCKMNLRHVPLLVAREMVRHKDHKQFVSSLLTEIIQRPDEMAELLAIYWKDGKCPLGAQIKKGLAKAFIKFDAYRLAKYNEDGAIKLRDVLFLCHAKPKDKEQEELWKKLIDGTLESPDTWEVNLSAGKDKKETWVRLLSENKLGALALLRNLRNMEQVGVDRKIVSEAIERMKIEKILPFRFITAARYNPQFEPQLEKVMIKNLEESEKLKGKTVLLVDISGSMDSPISEKSETTRIDVACGLAILAREICEDIEIWAFSDNAKMIPARRGFALRDAIESSMPHGSTYLGNALSSVGKGDRIIVFTDEQAHDNVGSPPCSKGYMVNVASNQNGVGYGKWHHIDGFSEAILHYIIQYEKEA